MGQYSAIIAHDIALSTVEYQTAKREVPTNDTKKKGAKKYKKVIAGLESNLQDADPKIAQLDEDTQKFRKILELYNVGGTAILHYEFVAFEYFLEYFGEKFRNYINRKVYVEDIILTKENSGVGGVDVMSFDLKRPSAFLNEIHSYLHSVLYLNNITGTNMVEFLVSIWDSQVNEAKAKEQYQEATFQISKKQKRDNGKSNIPAKIPMMLISVTKWYCEFLGSKAVSGTTAFSDVLNSFCNVDNSSVNSSFYTDDIELQALVELIGVQGAHFLDEQLLKMLTMSTITIAEIASQNSALISNINFRSTSLQLKEIIKKIPGIYI